MAESYEIDKPPKKLKTDEDNDESIHSVINDLSSFSVKRILAENSQRKSITLECNIEGREGTSILLLEKKGFKQDDIAGFLCEDTPLTKEFSNDIYGSYETRTPPDFSGVAATIIYPATEKHLDKYQDQVHHLVEETPNLYNTVCLPYILKEQLNIQWVLNILDNKAEEDRVAFEDKDPETGFTLLPDLKWDGTSQESLYLVALVKKTGIKSLRDLTADHLPLLKNVRDKGLLAIKNKYGLESSQLKVYFHYRPSFYHLHIHFVSLRYDAPGSQVEKAHLLSSVINNLELAGDYYQQSTLSFVVKESEKLFAKLQEHGTLQLKGINK